MQQIWEWIQKHGLVSSIISGAFLTWLFKQFAIDVFFFGTLSDWLLGVARRYLQEHPAVTFLEVLKYIVSGVASAAILSFVYFLGRQRPLVSQTDTENAEDSRKASEVRNDDGRPLILASLKELMHDEFPGVLRLWGDIALPILNSSETVTVHIVVYQDPRTGSEFLGLHVPAHEKTFEAIVWVLENYQETMRKIKGDEPASISIHAPGEQSPPTTVGATFTGKVYAYYVAPLTLQQLAQLESFAESKGLRVTFRDTTYLMSRQTTQAGGN